MPSFDVVSQVNNNEVLNAVNQAAREVDTRFDFKGTNARFECEDGQVTLRLGKNVIWKRRCISKSENEFVLEGNLVHKLIGDTLHIEGKYQAVRE